MRDLFPLLLVLAAATYIYVLRERRRRRSLVNPPLPDIAMGEAWASWGSAHPVPPRLREQAEKELLDAERYCLAADHPRLALRRAILECSVIALHLRPILELGEAERKVLLNGYEEGMAETLRNTCALCELKSAVFRHYARLKYDDATPDDWFDQFERVARPYVREKVRLARASLIELDEGAGRIARIYDGLLQDLQKDLLRAPPKKRFVPPDLPGN